MAPQSPEVVRLEITGGPVARTLTVRTHTGQIIPVVELRLHQIKAGEVMLATMTVLVHKVDVQAFVEQLEGLDFKTYYLKPPVAPGVPRSESEPERAKLPIADAPQPGQPGESDNPRQWKSPKTQVEMMELGYVFDATIRFVTCKHPSCDRRIFWVNTPTGASMPMQNAGERDGVYLFDPHWAHCPGAKGFRKEKR